MRQRELEKRKKYKREIDYEKLAEAIVLAQKKTENEKNSHHSVRARLLRFLNGCIYISFSFLCFYGIYYLWFVAGERVFDVVIRIVITMLLVAFGIVLFLSQQESLNESSRESSEFFNLNISLIALIIAFIALYQSITN